jgi:hypothetical protein
VVERQLKWPCRRDRGEWVVTVAHLRADLALASDSTEIIFWQGAGGHLVGVWWQGHSDGPNVRVTHALQCSDGGRR